MAWTRIDPRHDPSEGVTPYARISPGLGTITIPITFARRLGIERRDTPITPYLDERQRVGLELHTEAKDGAAFLRRDHATVRLTCRKLFDKAGLDRRERSFRSPVRRDGTMLIIDTTVRTDEGR